MFYGYVGYSTTTDKIYVITKAHNTPEEAETEREAKIKALPRRIYLANYFLSRGIIKTNEIIEIPSGYFGILV